MNKMELKRLCALTGVSGREAAVRDYIEEQLSDCPCVEEKWIDPLGNLLVRVHGRQRAAKTVLFSAHMDEVGLIVTSITDEGYLTISPVGGVEPAVVYGKTVRVNGRPGIIAGRAIHQCEGGEKNAVPAWDKLLIDIGVSSREEAESLVQPGDMASFEGELTELGDHMCCGKALDDRAGCLLLLELIRRQPEYDLLAAFVVQEELGLRGAAVAGYTLRPDIALTIETTTAADMAGVPQAKQVCRVGDGPVVSFMDSRTLYDVELYNRIREKAAEAGIPTQTKTTIAGGNDAGAYQQAGGGVKVAAVSLPCRYLHSPACVLSWQDMDSTQALLCLLADTLPGGDFA